jgi:hypothetical protein
MTESRPPRHGVRNALVLGAIAVFVVRLGLHAFTRFLDLVWIVVVIAAVVAVVCARSSRR